MEQEYHDITLVRCITRRRPRDHRYTPGLTVEWETGVLMTECRPDWTSTTLILHNNPIMPLKVL